VSFAPAVFLVILSCTEEEPPPPPSKQGLLDGPCLPNGGCNFPDLVCRNGLCQPVEDSGSTVVTKRDTGTDSSSKDSGSDASGPRTFRATLVASPNVTTPAQGTALLTLHTNGKACGTLAWQKLGSTYGGAHVHQGSVFDAGGEVTTASRDGGLEAATIAWTPTVDEANKLTTEGLYVDIHTQNYPGAQGEIRGQIKADPAAGVQTCP